MSEIKTWESVCEKLNISPDLLPDVSLLEEKDRKNVIAYYKLTKVAEALNDGWVPDWSNSDEYKYYPYFDMNPEGGSGFSFFGTFYTGWFATGVVGSRLCYRTRALAKHAGEVFIDLYRDFLK